MLKQSLEDEIKFANDDLAKAKACVSESSEAAAAAEGDLAVTTKDLESDEADLQALHSSCMQKAEDYETEKTQMGEELKALGVAKKAVEEKTAGATSQEYGLSQESSMSLLQVQRSTLRSRRDLGSYEVVRFIRDLARKQGTTVLAQLASRVAAASKIQAAAGEDPFAKIKGLITDMLSKLEAEADKDASQKAYCDKETSESSAKKKEKSSEIEKLTTKINSAKTK